MKEGIYILQKEDLLNAVRTVIRELKRTDIKEGGEDLPHSDRLSEKEAAALIGVSHATVANWRKKKLIPFYRIGNKVFYRKSELIEAAQQNKDLRRA